MSICAQIVVESIFGSEPSPQASSEPHLRVMANVKGCGFRAVCDNGNKRSTRKITCFSRVTG